MRGRRLCVRAPCVGGWRKKECSWKVNPLGLRCFVLHPSRCDAMPKLPCLRLAGWAGSGEMEMGEVAGILLDHEVVVDEEELEVTFMRFDVDKR